MRPALDSQLADLLLQSYCFVYKMIFAGNVIQSHLHPKKQINWPSTGFYSSKSMEI